MKTPSLNDLRREEFCRSLDRDPTKEEPFFCSLGTLWCTEAHGDSYEIPWVERYGRKEYREAVKARRLARIEHAAHTALRATGWIAGAGLLTYGTLAPNDYALIVGVGVTSYCGVMMLDDVE